MNNKYIPTEDDYAYIAGLIEGDGSFGIAKLKRRDNRYRYCPYISVQMKTRTCLDFLIKIFPTNIKILQKTGVFYLRYMALQTKEIINKIYPYLLIKKGQADILIKTMNLKDENRTLNIKTSHLYEEMIKDLNKLYSPPEYSISKNDIKSPKQLLIPTSIDLSYLAGIIDGEGSFGIYNSYNKTSNTQRMNCRFSITMNDIQAIKKIQSFFGFNIRILKSKKAFKLDIDGKKIICFINKIQKFLKLKKEQSNICLLYMVNHKNMTDKQKLEYMNDCQKAKYIEYILPPKITKLKTYFVESEIPARNT